MKKFLAVLIALIVAFGLGYIPQYMKVQQITAEFDQSRVQLEERIAEIDGRNSVLTLHGQLGMLLLEIENQNYGSARERSTLWFDRLRDVISNSPDEVTANALNPIMGQRDQMTALLTEAKPEALAMARDMYRSVAAVAGVK